ncbi:MAG: LysM peptidoglycan-binding domain-containing protein [Prevotellaceae bacterium]|jgi:RHS repeat-associated protein|nr:LysM peptidoglycan-binding domain-containing protein [Prevotellaceae bacterium]
MATYSEQKYEDGKIDLLLTEQHLYGSSRLGMRQVNELLVEKDEIKEFEPEYSSRNLGEKVFELSNHLGNVLAVVSDKKKADGTADVKAVYDYYPFGMTMPGRSLSGDYRYGFGGHEKDNEVSGDGNHLSFGDYGYDPRLGRRWNMDPILVPHESSYATFRNNPVVFSDPTGKCPDCPDGNYTVQNGDTYWGLENQWGLDHGTLEQLNPGVDPTNLQVGQNIVANTDIPSSFDQTYTTTTTTTYETQYKTQTIETSSNTVKYAGMAAAGLLADDVTGFGAIDDPLLIGVGVWAVGALIYDAVNSGTKTITYPVSVPVTTTSTSPNPFWYVTYTKTNPTTGQVYVGRSSGYAATPQEVVKRRDINHHMTSVGYRNAVLSTSAPATMPGGYFSRISDPSYWAIRGSEQLQIESYRSLGISGNTYNGISPTNDNLGKYINAAKNLFK